MDLVVGKLGVVSAPQSGPVHQNIQQIGAGDHTGNLVFVQHRQDALFVVDYFLLDFGQICLGTDAGQLAGHVITHDGIPKFVKKGFFDDHAGDVSRGLLYGSHQLYLGW